MGYGDDQVHELEETINATPADVVVEGTPIQLDRIIKRAPAFAPAHASLAGIFNVRHLFFIRIAYSLFYN